MAVLREDFWESAGDTRLLNGISAGATSLTVDPGGLDSWGPVTAGRFSVILSRGLANEEHVYGTAIAGDQITGLTGITQDHDPQETVEHGLRASHVDEPNAFLSLPQAKGDIAVATLADTWSRKAVGADGTVLAADSTQATGLAWSSVPLGVLPGGYAQITTSVDASSFAVTDVAGLSVTVTIPASRRLRVTIKGRFGIQTPPSDHYELLLREGSSTLSRLDTGTDWEIEEDRILIAYLAPSAGSHTYKVSFDRETGGTSGAPSFGGAADNPAYICVEDVGAA